ncbi:MAG: hypothetical protein ACP59X_12180 [Solidesulfovibrio sp. DCME]|uniref:hypothetical protein n=1 Tax=Solidesulfovibrio sp. DCME TaxID=3447380 RepID=UPI003D11F13A
MNPLKSPGLSRPASSRAGRGGPVAREPLPGALPFAPRDRVSAPSPWRGRLATWIMAIVWTEAGFAARCAGIKQPVPLAQLKRRGRD